MLNTETKKTSLYIYLPSDDHLIAHKHVYMTSKLFGFTSFLCHKNALLSLFFWALIYVRTNSCSRYGHIHILKKIIFFFHLYYIFDVCTHLNTHLNTYLNIHKEVLLFLNYELKIVFIQKIYNLFSYSGARANRFPQYLILIKRFFYFWSAILI